MRLFILSEGLVVTLMVSLMQTQDIKDCEERCREVEVEKESRSLCNSFCAQLSSHPVSAFLNGHYGNSRNRASISTTQVKEGFPSWHPSSLKLEEE